MRGFRTKIGKKRTGVCCYKMKVTKTRSIAGIGRDGCAVRMQIRNGKRTGNEHKRRTRAGIGEQVEDKRKN